MLPDAYGCAVANRFGKLLDDDADPFDLLNEAEIEKEKRKKKEEQKKTKQKKHGQKESQKDRRVPVAPDGQDPLTGRKQQARVGPAANESRGGKVEAQRGMKRAAFGERRANQEQHPEDYPTSKPFHDVDSEPRGRGGFRAGRGGRGGGYLRNPDNFNLRGKREYERHSGTGISPEEKRGGRGPWNWGSVQDTMGELMEVTSDAPVKPEEPQSPVEGEDQTSEVDGEMVVQVAVEMTLDEWKALQETSRPKVEWNLRKADSKVPSKARVIHQSKHIENAKGSEEDMEEEGHFLRRSVNDITDRLDINFGSLGRPSRGGRGRGGRAGLSRCPEMAKPKLEMVYGLAPNPDDPDDFPALTARR
ncbi:intracellular hyaluronan-binding protein 4 [Myripristis murdjan]|uniref:Intracellular hyaluronan-binding protein 4-like n=1 Tax=Myripristis murdjan TaxID=586833 RepID=A0A667Z3C5_9TELE|nr:intracellular hyaluronan-binding protein 4-like [Myripristis murdjan]